MCACVLCVSSGRRSGNWLNTKIKYKLRTHKLNYDRDRLEGLLLLELGEREFYAEHQWNHEKIIFFESPLQKSLQSLVEQVDNIQILNNQEKAKMAESMDAEIKK